jgi:disulfide bond formation protein DsbB
MLEAFPLADLLQAMLVGTGNCAAVDWSLFGISIAGWVLIAVAGLAALAVAQFRAARPG